MSRGASRAARPSSSRARRSSPARSASSPRWCSAQGSRGRLPQHPLEGPPRRGEAAELEEGDAALVLGVDVARVEGHRLLEVVERLPAPPQVVLGHPGQDQQARRERRIGARAGGGARGAAQGQVEPRLERVAVAEAGHVELGGHEEGGRVVRVGGQQPGEGRAGVGVAVERGERQRPFPERRPVARVDLERLLGAGERRLVACGLPGAGGGLRELTRGRAVLAGQAGAGRLADLGDAPRPPAGRRGRGGPARRRPAPERAPCRRRRARRAANASLMASPAGARRAGRRGRGPPAWGARGPPRSPRRPSPG